MEDENFDPAESPEPCWPFWGQISEDPSYTYKRLILEWPANDYFKRFNSIGMNALRMLERRDLVEIRGAATEIQTAIEEWIDLYVEQETESRVQTLYRDGGWELGYLPQNPSHEEAGHAGYAIRASEDEIRDLLTNWSSEWDDRPSLPSRDDFSDLTVLQECLGFDVFDESELIHFGLFEPEEHEFFAVLVLMVVCEAVHSNPRKKIDHYWLEPTLSQVKAIGHATIHAVEAMAHATHVKFERSIRSSNLKQQSEILAKELSRQFSERAVNAAKIRHGAINKARDWVYKEWTLHRQSYSGNKAEFSRIYAARVKNEFLDSKDEPLSVTVKTISEVWLKDTPTARKSAGVPGKQAGMLGIRVKTMRP